MRTWSLSMRLLPPILVMICLLAFVGTPGALAQAVVLNLSPASGTPGDTVSMELSLIGDARPGGLQWSMSYSAMDLIFQDAEPGPSATAAGKSIQCGVGAGMTTCLMVGLNRNTIPAGVLATLTLAIPPDSSANSAIVKLSGVAATSVDGDGILATGNGNVVTINQDTGTPLHRITGVLDAAAFQPFIAPGAIVSVFGNFAMTTATATTLPLSTELNGISFTFNGIPGAVFGVFGDDARLGFNQANVQVPWNLALNGELVDVRVHRREDVGEIVSDPFEVAAGPTSPGIFEFPIGSGQAIVTNFKLSEEDDVVAGSFAQPEGAVDPVVGQPVAIGGVVTIWLNGLGSVSPPVPNGDAPGVGAPLAETDKTVRVQVGGVEAQILGKPVLHPTLVALNQINVVVSPETPIGDRVPIVIAVDCGDGQVFPSKAGVTIAVRAAPNRNVTSITK